MTIGNAYLTRMPSGFAGMITRQDQCTLQPEIIDITAPPLLYGVFCKLTAGKVRPITTGDAAADVRGLIAKPYPFQEASVSSAVLGESGVPNPALPCDLLKRGYMVVKFAGTTAAKGGQVNVNITAAAGLVAGDISETTDGNNVAVANCFFMGAADANGMVEISYNIER